MENKSVFSVMTTIMFVAVVVGIVGLLLYGSFNDTEYIVTVTDKERVNDGETSKYLVFCENEDGEVLVFQNSDEMLRGKFKSSNMQGYIKVGKRYKLTVVGFRIPITSVYQNIIKVEEI